MRTYVKFENFLGAYKGGAYSGGQKRGQNLVLIRVVGAYRGGANLKTVFEAKFIFY